jgi:hypothetical protein
MLSGCAMYRTPEGGHFHTLGIAEIKVCETFEGREDLLVERCSRLDTDAFSGWAAIIEGTGNVILKIFTFGLL